MVIGVPKEIKKGEYRVSITPPGVEELRRHGHGVYVETGAGEGSGFSDAEYLAAGARSTDRRTLFAEAELIVKVKELLPEEFGVCPQETGAVHIPSPCAEYRTHQDAAR